MKRTLALILVALAALTAAATAGATVVHISTIDITTAPALHPYWSGICGFDIYTYVTGHQDTTLVLNQDGLVVSQIDKAPDAVFTLIANGKRMDWPSSLVSHYTYPDGATLGAPVEVAITGLNAQVPGLPADAGLQLYRSHVTGFVGQVPQWEGIWGGAEWIARIGHWSDLALVDAAICSGLSAT